MDRTGDKHGEQATNSKGTTVVMTGNPFDCLAEEAQQDHPASPLDMSMDANGNCKEHLALTPYSGKDSPMQVLVLRS